MSCSQISALLKPLHALATKLVFSQVGRMLQGRLLRKGGEGGSAMGRWGGGDLTRRPQPTLCCNAAAPCMDQHHPSRWLQVRAALGVRRTIVSGGGSLAAHLDDFFEAIGEWAAESHVDTGSMQR